MQDISVRQGETVKIPVTIEDSTAVSVEMVIVDGDTAVKTVTATFVDDTALLDLGIITLPVKSYTYGFKITYTDGVVDILPDTDCQECEYPTFEVCKGLPA